jgi:hypothetical protein
MTRMLQTIKETGSVFAALRRAQPALCPVVAKDGDIRRVLHQDRVGLRAQFRWAITAKDSTEPANARMGQSLAIVERRESNPRERQSGDSYQTLGVNDYPNLSTRPQALSAETTKDGAVKSLILKQLSVSFTNSRSHVPVLARRRGSIREVASC